jgi:enoyl-CoA hydratase
MDDLPRLLTHQTGRVLTVTFNNHPRHFFDRRMAIELDDLTRNILHDKTIGAVVFTGTERMYITHMDVPLLLGASQALPFEVPYAAARVIVSLASVSVRSATAARVVRRTPVTDLEFAARTYAALRRMNTMDKVFITAINGLALGMGCVFALACDLRIIADDAMIGLPESAIAMLAAAGGTQRLIRIVGSGRSLELLLDGRPLDAETASQYGLVNRVVARSDLYAETASLAQRMANRSPRVNREIKRMVYDAGGHRFPRATRMEAASLVATVTSPQARQIIRDYHHWLAAHPELTDNTITSGFDAVANG